MKKFYFVIGLLLISASSFPQIDTAKRDTMNTWRTGGFLLATFNQVSLTNWTAGGENALSATGILNLFAKYRTEKVVWDNFLDLGYGILRSNSQVRKNEDKIEFLSKLGYKAFDKVYYSLLLDYRTQFAKGYNYPNDSVVVSKFNAPGYIILSAGLDWKPNDYFSFFLSPATGKFTIVADNALSNSGAYGVERGKKLRSEFGASLNMKFLKDIFKNVNLATKLELFNNYTDSDKGNRKNIDVNWEVMLNIKAGKYLTTTILTDLVYDQNTIAKTQFKEVLGVGLSFKF